MNTNDTTGFEPHSRKFRPRNRERQRNVVFHVAGGEKKTRNYNHPIVAPRNCVEPIGKRRFGEFDISMPDIKLSLMRPKVRDQLLEFQIRGLFATSVADN